MYMPIMISGSHHSIVYLALFIAMNSINFSGGQIVPPNINITSTNNTLTNSSSAPSNQAVELTFQPTSFPSGSPTNSPITPTDVPTPLPTTSSPTKIPSTLPSTLPSLHSSNFPSQLLTSKPSKHPTNRPSSFSSTFPSSMPTMNPTLSQTETPSSYPSDHPSNQPSEFPSQTPSFMPSSVVSKTPSGQPTVPATEAVMENLLIILEPILPLDEKGILDWQQATSSHIKSYYDDISEVYDVSVETIYESQDPPYNPQQNSLYEGDTENRRLGFSSSEQIQRKSQSSLNNRPGELTITYRQIISYRDATDLFPAENFVQDPFSNLFHRDKYIKTMKSTNNPAFQSIETVTNVRFAPRNVDTDDGDRKNMLYIIIGCSSVAAILMLVIFCFCFKRRGDWKRNGNKSSDFEAGGQGASSPQKSYGTGGSDIYSPTPQKGPYSSGDSFPGGYGDQSITTVDYDYSKAYGGDTSVSSAGGTLGDTTRGTGATNPSLSRITPSLFSADDSFDDRQYGPPGGSENRKEEIIDIFCPPGKLGVVIDTPDDGAPIVHAIKDTSVILDKLRVGDKLIAVDDADVRSMTAIKVSKMISRKGHNPTRKLTVIRSVA